MRNALISILLLAASSFSYAQLKFAVSGDSRNCGDVIMPLIAADAHSQGAQFYWHLGDLRAMYDIDQDMGMRAGQPHMTISEYANAAWPDFIENEISAFGTMPFYLGIGNHETYLGKTRADFIGQFADWLNSPTLQAQRLKDDPKDHRVKTYFHWIQGGVDFIYLDNATPDQFDAMQMAWFTQVLARAETNKDVHSVVVGMHAVLPDSLTPGHSMNDWPQGAESGRKVYAQLLAFREKTKKPVYALASHSHFFVANVFNTEANRTKKTVIPGWIVGTAGAFRYNMPPTVSEADQAKTGVYGYLLGAADAKGGIKFEFREVKESELSPEARQKFGPALLDYCFQQNKDPMQVPR
ncbi:MAG TPA: hypothetical protein VFP40_07105 [Terriglobales bacterium]|nr:hypothetical protein [Terriglobales bacterium]